MKKHLKENEPFVDHAGKRVFYFKTHRRLSSLEKAKAVSNESFHSKAIGSVTVNDQRYAVVYITLALIVAACCPQLPAQQATLNYLGLLKSDSQTSNKLSSGQQAALDYLKGLKAKAEKGDPQAQDILGDCYFFPGWGPQDKSEAAKWFLKAAKQGVVDAQYNLGIMYYKGDSLPQDYSQAGKWFRKAAEQGDASAEYVLASMYHSGEGVAQDNVDASKYWLKAAKQGHAEAQYNIGAAYFTGDGVPKNYVEAYKWTSLAAAQGLEIAKKYLSVDEMRMTRQQVAEAQQSANEFKPRKESSSENSASPVNPAASGTGFLITEDGYLISNYHVVKGAARVRLLTSAGLIDAKVVQVDAADDLALLKANGRFSPLPVASSRSVSLGETVATIGFPDPGLQGFSPKLAKGEIASQSGAADDPRYFQISVPVQPGNSGGALVDEHGNAVGIVSAKLDASAALAATGALPENVNYAIKSSFLLSFLESVPGVEAKLKPPVTADRKFEDVVKSAQAATVLVLVY